MKYLPFCKKCGAELSEDDEFCPRCGTPVTTVTPKVVREVPTGRSKKVYFLAAALVLVLALAALGAWFMMSPPAPEVTPSPTSTPSITPFATPKPTSKPTATPAATPKPTAAPTPTKSPGATSTPQPTPAVTPSGEVFAVENFKDLLDLAPEMSYRWTDSDGTKTDISYKVIGEESINGVQCWVVEGTIEDDKDKKTFTVWVSKDDGKAKKVKMEDMEFTGDMAEQFWQGFGMAMMMPFVTGTAWHLWEIPRIVDPTYGTVQYLGNEVRKYGETTLTVGKYRFLPGTAWYESDLDHLDYWLSNIDSYLILTYFKAVDKNGDWGSYELLRIKLA